MINTYEFLWKRLADYAKKFQSGMDVVDEFNTRLAEVQLELVNTLAPYYQVNEKVRSIMSIWVRSLSGTSSSTGLIVRPPVVDGVEFMRVLSMGYVNSTGLMSFDISQTTEGEIVIANRIPQRRPSIAKRIVNYVSVGNTIQLYPQQAIQYSMFYLVYPKEAKIAFAYTSIDDEDVMTLDVANTVNLAWDKTAANIILYMMMEKYGVGNREMLLVEYGKLGINASLNEGGSND